MNKITKFLLIIVCVLLVIYFFVNGYASKNENMAYLVGNKIGGGELSVSEYYSIAQCVETYQNYLAERNYETAYKMLNNNYKEYISFEEFKNKVSKKDYAKSVITDIEVITATTFHVKADVSGEKEDYTIIINSENSNFLLLPESFLDYRKSSIKTSKNNLNCELIDYLVNTNETVIHFDITNEGNEEIKISGGKLYTNLDDQVENDIDVTIPAKTKKEISMSFETNYAFPNKVIIYRSNGEKKNIEYNFEIEE
ncbi:MAG: hypothetical protein IJ220_08360 [Clostridia bacterium]|nr:hypothetical protein [Clostridia bacterium]